MIKSCIPAAAPGRHRQKQRTHELTHNPLLTTGATGSDSGEPRKRVDITICMTVTVNKGTIKRFYKKIII